MKRALKCDYCHIPYKNMSQHHRFCKAKKEAEIVATETVASWPETNFQALYYKLKDSYQELETKYRKQQNELTMFRNRYNAMRESMSTFGRLIAVFMGESTE